MGRVERQELRQPGTLGMRGVAVKHLKFNLPAEVGNPFVLLSRDCLPERCICGAAQPSAQCRSPEAGYIKLMCHVQVCCFASNLFMLDDIEQCP